MTGRKRAYYSEEQIQRNLFTNGKEWMKLDTWEEYVGPYHKYSTGEVFTEIDWTPNVSMKLIPYRNRSDMYFRYADITEYEKYGNSKRKVMFGQVTNMGNFRTPVMRKLPPTNQDFKNGFMNRYFVYKRNDINNFFIEIDVDQAKTFNDSNYGINQILYNLVTIKWKLNGPEYDEYYNGILMYPGVVDTNSRIIEENSKKFRIFASVLNNPREYTIYDGNF
jgi:hypothetical protein